MAQRQSAELLRDGPLHGHGDTVKAVAFTVLPGPGLEASGPLRANAVGVSEELGLDVGGGGHDGGG